MDEELRELETELKGLRPARLRDGWQVRLQRELGTDPQPVPAARSAARPNPWWWLATLPAAAAIALVLRLAPEDAGHDRAVPAQASAALAVEETLKPVAAQNVLYAAEDEGIVTLDDGRPARRERLHFVDTVTWRHPRTNASLTWSVPREEVRIVPVNFQ